MLPQPCPPGAQGCQTSGYGWSWWPAPVFPAKLLIFDVCIFLDFANHRSVISADFSTAPWPVHSHFIFISLTLSYRLEPSVLQSGLQQCHLSGQRPYASSPGSSLATVEGGHGPGPFVSINVLSKSRQRPWSLVIQATFIWLLQPDPLW